MIDDLGRARAYAITAHGDQKYGSEPYVFHLDAVVAYLTPYGELAQVVGYLHDVVEDTQTSLEEIRREFGDRVAESVALVTDESGVNRKERKQRTNKKLASVSGQLELALIVKAADRLANLTASANEAGSKLETYRREHPAFREAAYRPGLCEPLWLEMDRLLSERRGL